MIENLDIRRIIDLSIPSDRKELRDTASFHPELSSLLDEYLDDYFDLFPDPQCRKVHSAGTLSIACGRAKNIPSDLLRILRLVKAVRRLRQFEGFGKLIDGLNTNFYSTVFEIFAASWCADRQLSESIQFWPDADVKGKVKHPDFLWSTKLGEIFCECKKLNLGDNKTHRMMENLLKQLEHEYKQWEWPDHLRLDVRFEGGTTNRIQHDFSAVVSAAASAVRNQQDEGFAATSGNVSAELLLRTDQDRAGAETIRVGLASVGPVAVNLMDATYLSLTASMSGHYKKGLKKLLKEARTQIPPFAKGALFIDIFGNKTPEETLKRTLRHPTYDNTPWVSLWVDNQFRCAAWQEGQPFDRRLLN
jgi:hypothetical protein